MSQIRIGFAIPGDLATPTGGYRYDAEIMRLLPDFGVRVLHIPLADCYPFPDEVARTSTIAAIKAHEVDLWLIDGLAFGAFGPMELAALQAPVIALLHHPLGDESGLEASQSERLYRSEHQALQHAKAVIVTSQATAHRVVSLFGLDEDHILVAVPGVRLNHDQDRLDAERDTKTLKLLAVGSVSPRKGYDVLISALAPLAGLDWHLTIAGRLDDLECVQRLQAQCASAGLSSSITWAGAVADETMETLWSSHDALLFPSRYEGYGMVLAEALAHGLAVVCSDQVPAARNLSKPAVFCLGLDDQTAWTSQIHHWLEDRQSLAFARQAARAVRGQLPQWRDSAALIAGLLHRLASGSKTDDKTQDEGSR